MPSSATITSFYNFTANTRARATQVNTNFDAFRGHLVPIEPLTATSSDISHDLGSDEHRWRTSYVKTVDFDRLTSTAISFIQGGSTIGSIFFYCANSISANIYGTSSRKGVGGINELSFDTTAPAFYIQRDINTTAAECLFYNNGAESFRVIENGFKGKNYKTFGTTNVASSVQIGQSNVIALNSGPTVTATSVANSTLTISTIGRPVIISTKTFTDSTTHSGFIASQDYRVQIYRNGSMVHSSNITGNMPCSTIHFVDTECSSGTHIYDLRFRVPTGTTGTGNLIISNFYITAFEV
jgi:hypothetical protein